MPILKKSLSFLPLFLATATIALAQNTTVPVVTVKATDSYATWSGDTGTFTFLRDGPTNQMLNVFYQIHGTATNGVDYAAIGNWVIIPAGTRSNAVIVSPLNHGQTNIETVVVKLSASPLGIAQNYQIGYPDTDTVYVTPDGVTNIPPNVTLFAPTNGEVFTSPVNLSLAAFGGDVDGYVSSVEFFAGNQSLGVVSNGAIVDPPFPPGAGPGSRAFFLTWSNTPPGKYVLTAKAVDDGGASTVSSPVSISVQSTPPPTNKPPLVKITHPGNGDTFYSPVNLSICASGYDADGYVSTVEFFAGAMSLGITTNNPMSAGPMNPFCLTWSNVPPSRYTLTAVATDNSGASTLSDPVMILVSQGPPPPPTNFPPLVRISSPPNGALFRSPADVALFAYATELGGAISTVEFFADTNNLGFGHTVCPQIWPAGPGSMLNCPSNFFALTWSNAPIGTHVLTAVATDTVGTMATSGPVKISIVSSPTPPTNRPPIISVVATDPLAIEGTNCWPWLGIPDATPTWAAWTGSRPVWRFFTNCGPKNAAFTVRRYGDTNEDLTVAYDLGGSATNGVDYLPLPGTVVVPAGQRHAQITIVPLDDGVPDITSTVVLKLAPATNYLLGYPRSAAALILDGPAVPLHTGELPDGTFHLQASGPDGAWFHIDYSTNLVDWTSLCTNQVVNGSIDFIDPDAQHDHSRFYRTIPQNTPPP